MVKKYFARGESLPKKAYEVPNFRDFIKSPKTDFGIPRDSKGFLNIYRDFLRLL